MYRALLATPALALALVLMCLSGCGTDESPPAAADPTPAHSTSPTPSGPAEPTMPSAAYDQTRAGAIAFAKYYWALVNFAMEALDTSALRRVQSSRCASCAAGTRRLEQLKRRHAVVVGGASRVISADAFPLDSQRAAWTVQMRMATTAQAISHAGDLNQSRPADRFIVDMTLAWKASAWTVIAWETH